MKKILSLLLVLVLSLSLLSGCEMLKTLTGDGNTVAITGEEELYENILKLIKDYELSASFSGVNEDEVIATYLKVVEEHPECFWVSTGYNLEILTTDKGDKTINLKIISSMDKDKLPEMEKALKAETDKVVEKAKVLSTDYEKAIFVHDWLIDNARYDLEAADAVLADTAGQTIYEESTAYGCIVTKDAICSGYSAAYQHILNQLGIECGKVGGKRNGGEDHQWNYIKLDGDYYYVDVTWDDPVNEDGIDTKSYEFFGLTTKELEKTHTIEKVGFIPECTATKYNYFIYNKLYIEDYSFAAVSEIITRNIKKGTVEIKFKDQSELEKATKDLLDREKIFSISGVPGDISYGVGESGRVLSIFF